MIKQCDKCFSQRGNLKNHESIHTGDLKKDETHTGEKLFKCKQCDLCFRQQANLKRHFRIHEKGEYICWICQEKLNSEKLLSKHYQDHIALLP